MDKATAVEVAHQIQHLLKTRGVIEQLDKIAQVVIPDEISITVIKENTAIVKVSIPPHVMRRLVEDGSLLKACKLLERDHELTLTDIAGITVEKE